MALIGPIAWEPPHATGAALKEKRKKQPPPKKKPIKTKFFQKLGKLASETVDNPRNTGRKGPGLEVTCVP